MMIWGFRRRQKVLDKGTFFCPSCKQRRPFKLKRAGTYFSLYFIPLLKVKSLGKFVECQVCHRVFEPEVLDPGSQDTLQLVASTRYALLHGTHPSAAKSQLMDAGTDARTADHIIEMAQK